MRRRFSLAIPDSAASYSLLRETSRICAEASLANVKNGRITMRVLYCLLAALLAVATVTAQVGGTGTIQGTVTDPSGAVLAGASVVATNVETGVQTSRKTTEAGFFVLSPLQPGEYTVTIKAEGFQTLTQKSLEVVALGTLGLNPTMQLGASTTSITVEAAPPLLHTDDATLGSTMET